MLNDADASNFSKVMLITGFYEYSDKPWKTDSTMSLMTHSAKTGHQQGNQKTAWHYIRKFTYNILRLTMMNDPRNKTMPEMIDRFADDHSLIEEYVFSGTASFY